MSEAAKLRSGIKLHASGGNARTVPMTEAQEESPLCWICLDSGGVGRSLVQPCLCPRPVHANCLARWQLQSAGSRREVACEFCDSQLPDWKKTLTPVCGATAPAVMNVNFDGRTYSFEVHPGPEGYQQFTAAICRAFCLPGDSELNITFTCDEPTAIEPLLDDSSSSEPLVPVLPLASDRNLGYRNGASMRRPSSVSPSPRRRTSAQLPDDRRSGSRQQWQIANERQPPQSLQSETLAQGPQSSLNRRCDSPIPSSRPRQQPPSLPRVLLLPLPNSSSRQNGAWDAAELSSPPSQPGMLLTLQGAGAYDAAVHCASVSAARRLLQERLLAASMPPMLTGSSSARGTAAGLGHRPYSPPGLGRRSTHSSSTSAPEPRRKKRISAIVSRKLRTLCDMLSLGK